MYDLRTEISQNGEYTATFLKDKEGRDLRIGNLEGEIIIELQDKLTELQSSKDLWEMAAMQTKDKLHRRNMQIKDLKAKLSRFIYEKECPRDEKNHMACDACFVKENCIINR